jgi:hypothetical protein
LWRKIQELGFAKAYNTDQGVRMFFRSFAIMAFLPVEDVLDNGTSLVLDWLKEKYPEYFVTYKSFVKYFEDTYIGEKKRGRGAGSRKEPLFAVAAWNVHNRTLTGLPRTSNNIEGWHHGVIYSVLKQKQNHLLSVIDGLKLEQSHTTNLYTRLKTGTTEQRRKPLYVLLDERISNVVSEYSAEKIDEFFANMCLIIEYN